MDEKSSNLYSFYRKNALLISKIQRTEESFRKQFQHHGGHSVAELSADLKCLEQYPQYLNVANFQKCITNIISSLQNEDYPICADYLESLIYDVLLPLQQVVFSELQEYISELYNDYASISKEKIRLEETPLGYTTIFYNSEKSCHLCSTIDPMNEAYLLSKENYEPNIDAYHIWGLGLGYHIYALDALSNNSAEIYVYDNDEFLFEIARSESLGSWQSIFKSPRIHLIADPKVTQFSQSFNIRNTKHIIHTPSIYKLAENNQQEIKRKNILKKLQITINGFTEIKNDLYINFYKNIKLATGYAEELFPIYEKQNIVIVAAGPSLDKNISVLKKAYDGGAPIKILAVGTVLKKLLQFGIKPNAFFVMDSGYRIYDQIDGLGELKIPLIFDSTAYFRLIQNYNGKKYMAAQKDFELSEKLGKHLFNTGGSVTTLALDFSIQSKADKIILIGCDMAYTNNQSHAKNTARLRDTSNENVVSVKAYYGDYISTSLALMMYREWIENRIKIIDAKGIEFINSTEGGAYIEGMKHFPLNDVLESIQ